MERINPTVVQNKIDKGYNFDLGKYLTEGFNIFKQEWLLFSIYGLVMTFILLFSYITIIGPLFIMYPLTMGYCVAAEKVEKGEQLQFNDFFGAFKNFGQYAILTLITMLITILILSPVFFMFGGMTLLDNGGDPEAASALIGALGVFGMLYYFVAIFLVLAMSIMVFFAPYLIHYGNYSAVNALKTSIKLVKKKFLYILLFVFLVQTIAGLGVYLCIIGMFASMAVGALMNYSAVKDILLTDGNSEIDQIGNHGYTS